MDQFFQALSRLGPMRLAAMLGITAGITIALVMLSSGIGQVDKGLLYSELNLKEAGEISARLDQMGIKYDLRNGGSAIFVERGKIETAKLTLAGENLPSSGSVGYDIFDQTSSMGQTTFIQNTNRLRALQGELERTISTIAGIDAARVLLALPERQLFQTETEKATASITIKVRGGAIGSQQINAIRHLVAAAVPKLAVQNVTIVDDTGRVLAGGDDTAENGGRNGADQRANVEETLSRKIRQVLATIVGTNGVEVQINAELDLNRITETSVIYDPDGQVVVSSDTSEQISDEKDQQQNGAVTIGQNIPGAPDDAFEPGSSATTSSTTETINFSNSKTETTRIYQSGAVTRLSIAVNVDGQTETDAEGNISWTPRSAEEMLQIENLVKSAVGFNVARNDQLEVTNIRFMKPTPLTIDGAAQSAGFDKNDIMRMIELGILAIVSVVVVFFLGRPLLSTLASGGSMGGGGALPALAGAGGGALGACRNCPEWAKIIHRQI
ncbi:MAG: flagellar M-ring protein FliF [Robiginitomaculum sp.]|nr:flagellar M-ring protein FliF [Robiginitomaculum sp.]